MLSRGPGAESRIGQEKIKEKKEIEVLILMKLSTSSNTAPEKLAAVNAKANGTNFHDLIPVSDSNLWS